MDNDKDNHKTFFISISPRIWKYSLIWKNLNPDKILGYPKHIEAKVRFNFICYKNYVKQVVHESTWTKTPSEIVTCLWMEFRTRITELIYSILRISSACSYESHQYPGQIHSKISDLR